MGGRIILSRSPLPLQETNPSPAPVIMLGRINQVCSSGLFINRVGYRDGGVAGARSPSHPVFDEGRDAGAPGISLVAAFYLKPR